MSKLLMISADCHAGARPATYREYLPAKVRSAAEDWWKEREAAVLEVCDEGPGIPPDQLDTILEKFKQLETSETRAQGVGLGLAVSHTLVEHFGGDLWAESEEGCGSRFFVRLRLAQIP